LSLQDGGVENNIGSRNETDGTTVVQMKSFRAGADEVKAAQTLQIPMVVVKAKYESWSERTEAELNGPHRTTGSNGNRRKIGLNIVT
jgi:hypothetical protein